MTDLTKQHEMTKEERQAAWFDNYLRIAKGDVAAASYLEMFNYVVHVWDDLIDKDNPRSDEEINRAFFILMVEIPRNAFFLKYSNILTSYTQVYINLWLDANKLETMGEAGLERAFAQRDVTGDLMGQVAYIVGGYQWMREVSEMEIPSTLAYERMADYVKDRGQKHD